MESRNAAPAECAAIHRTERTPFAAEFLKNALEATRRNNLLEEGARNASMARMYFMSAELDASTTHWKAALANDRRNLNYRYEYAKSLLRCKDYEAALKQAVLGQTLEPQSTRFKALAERIETESIRHQVNTKKPLRR